MTPFLHYSLSTPELTAEPSAVASVPITCSNFAQATCWDVLHTGHMLGCFTHRPHAVTTICVTRTGAPGDRDFALH